MPTCPGLTGVNSSLVRLSVLYTRNVDDGNGLVEVDGILGEVAKGMTVFGVQWLVISGNSTCGLAALLRCGTFEQRHALRSDSFFATHGVEPLARLGFHADIVRGNFQQLGQPHPHGILSKPEGRRILRPSGSDARRS